MVGWLIASPGPRGPVGLESGAMPDLKSIQSIYLVLGFIVPGMIIAFVRAQFLTGRLRTLSESIVTYIALTVLYYGLAAPFVEYVLTFEEPGRAKIAAWLALIIVVPAIVCLVLGALAQTTSFDVCCSGSGSIRSMSRRPREIIRSPGCGATTSSWSRCPMDPQWAAFTEAILSPRPIRPSAISFSRKSTMWTAALGVAVGRFLHCARRIPALDSTHA
jgi:hypothetical protein